MPIRPEMKDRYPKDWPQIVEKILTRAGQRRNTHGAITRNARCEWCGVENGAIGYRDKAGKFVELSMPEAEWATAQGQKVITILLTTAHVRDPAPENCADENLASLCQRCHLNHDRDHHSMMRVQNEVDRDVAAGQMLIQDLLRNGEVSR